MAHIILNLTIIYQAVMKWVRNVSVRLRSNGKTLIMLVVNASLWFRMPTYLFMLMIFALSSPHAQARRTIETHEVIVKKGDVFEGIKYPPGTRVDIEDRTNSVGYVFLSRDFKMNGHVIMKGTQLDVQNGKLSCYWSKEGQKVNKITLHKDAQVCFRRDGTLEMIHLDSANKIQGYSFARNTWVHFHPTGKVERGEIGKMATIEGIRLRVKGEISFFPSGKKECVPVSEGSKLGGYPLAPIPSWGYSCDAEFWPNGKLKKAVLAETTRIEGKVCGPGEFAFVESGQLSYCQDAKATP